MKFLPYPSATHAIRAIRLVWLVYLIGLTWLLLDGNPGAVLRSYPSLRLLAKPALPWMHLTAFGVLAALSFAARWPVPRRGVLGFLIFFSLATEFSQFFVPTRCVEAVDLLQNFAGIAAGYGLAWAAGVGLSLSQSPYARSV